MLVEIRDSFIFDVFDLSVEVGQFCLELFTLAFKLFFVVQLSVVPNRVERQS